MTYRSFFTPGLPSLAYSPGANEYKLGELPLTIFQDAVNEFEAVTGLPGDFAYVCALGAMAMCCQNLVDVQSPDGKIGPVSLMIIGVGETGSGKTVAGEHFLTFVEEFEASDWPALEGRSFLYKDTTAPALMTGLHELRMGGLMSFEGKDLMTGLVQTASIKLNALWSGETIRTRRVHTGNRALRHARLTKLVMIQPGVLGKVLRKKGEELRDDGFLGRLITAVATTQRGGNPFARSQLDTPAKKAFEARGLELLKRNVAAADDPNVKREVLVMSDQAAEVWRGYRCHVVQASGPGGYLECAPEHARRLAENVARVAALLHVYEGFDGPISEAVMWCAIAICQHYSQHYLSYFVPEVTHNRDADCLSHWLSAKHRSIYAPPPTILQADLARYGPRHLRDPEMIDQLLATLEQRGELKSVRQNGRRYVELKPLPGQPIVIQGHQYGPTSAV